MPAAPADRRPNEASVIRNSTQPPPGEERGNAVAWHRNIRTLRIVVQVVAAVAVLGLLAWMGSNLITNLQRQNIGTDFGFLDDPTRFQIPFDDGFDPQSPVWQMVLVGLRNTFLAGLIGILIASAAGLIVGIARLSSNWLVAKVAQVYVETFRNIPPLVIIIFFGFAIFTYGPFPILSEATTFSWPGSSHSLLILSNRTWGVPSIVTAAGAGWLGIALVAGAAAAYLVGRWRTRRGDRTGRPPHRVVWFLATFLVIGAAAFFITGKPASMSWPVVSENLRRIDGGFVLNYGFISVALALGLYTASHIAEIIRGSIQAVPKGQSEAANAIALSALQRYRFVVLPQALRIAVPPTINQYLNLVKNTSLGIAVAYAEVTALTLSSIGNGRPAPQSIAILMVAYLSFSLTISLILNMYNRRIQLVER